LPTLLIRNLLAEIAVDRLVFHQTFVDTTILPREIDCSLGKGTERYRITAIRTDTVDRGVCPKTALPFSYSTPHEVICASVLA